MTIIESLWKFFIYIHVLMWDSVYSLTEAEPIRETSDKWQCRTQYWYNWQNNQLTNFMDLKPPWEDDSRLSIQEFTTILWSLNVRYRAQNSQPLVPMLSQVNSFHIILSSFITIHFNIVAYRPVPKRWLCNQRPLLGKTYTHATIKELCFLCDPGRDVISKAVDISRLVRILSP
jgi:hypothetical protein